MGQSILLLIAGFVLLTIGAESLVRGGVSLSRRMGLTPLSIGLTVVAFGTSAPETVVSIGGALRGAGDMAVGNVVGSNIFNIGVILGIAAIVSPLRVQSGVIRLDAPFVILTSLLGLWAISSGSISRTVGSAFLLLLVGYVALSLRLAQRQNVAETGNRVGAEGPYPLWLEWTAIAGGLALLFFGSGLLVDAATAIARALGISEAVIGLTIVAAGTSLPELATSLVAAVRGQDDISIGNIIGSNIFNVLGILGLASTVRPLSAPGIRSVDLWTMVGYSGALLALIWTGRALRRYEGCVLVMGYLVYLLALWNANAGKPM